MKPDSTSALANKNTTGAYLYGATLFMLALSGFAQMPIFKRYYIADIPGLGWLAQFYTTHFLHYLFAALFIALGAYKAAAYMMLAGNNWRITGWGYLRFGLLAGLVLSGGVMVVRNLAGVYFSPASIIVMDIVHLGLVMLFLGTALSGYILRKPWLEKR